MASNRTCVLPLLLLISIIIKQNYCGPVLNYNFKLPRFKCPSKEHYIVIGNDCIISANDALNPSDTEYEWKIIDAGDIDMDDANRFYVPSDDEEEFKIYNDDQFGEIRVKLIMEHESRTKTRCDMKIIFLDTPHFGIDLGTTFSCIAYQLRDEDPKTGKRHTKIVKADPNGQFCIATAIYFPKNTENILFGQAALNMLPIDPQNVIYDIKRVIGRQWADKEVKNFMDKHLFKVVQDEGNERKFKIVIPNRNNMKISPEQALASVIIHLVQIATKRLGVKYDENINVVISIPAFFHNAQRRAVKSIAKIAKLNAKLLVVEPTAAAIAHTYYSSIPSDDLKLFVIFDWGGGTLDCSVMRCFGMTCDVLATSGNSTLGGIDFDHVIKDIIVSKLINNHGIHENDIDHGFILRDAEEIKISLTINDRTSYKYKNKPEIIITKTEFETHEQTQKLLISAIQTLNNAIAASTKRFIASNVRMIMMVGGTSNIPIVLETLKNTFGKTMEQRAKEDTVNEMNNRFGNSFLASIMQNIWNQPSDTIENEDKKLGSHQIRVEFPERDPQLMVITGSAILGGSLAFDTVNVGVDTNGAASHFTAPLVRVKDVIPLSLGFEVCVDNECGKMSVMIPKDSRYPLNEKKPYCQHDNTVNNVTMDLYEGDSIYVSNNYYLSELTVQHLLPRTDVSKCNTFHMLFNIDDDGIADIQAIAHKADGTDGDAFTMSLSLFSKNGSLSDCEIKEMQNQMISWFKSKKIRKLLKVTPCKLPTQSPIIIIKNYVYLDASGSMSWAVGSDGGGVGFAGGVKVFELIGASLLQQFTSITVFGSKSKVILQNQVGKWTVEWTVENIIKQWKANDMGGTFMWKMILDDILNKHRNLKERARLTIITDGMDNMSPSEFNGLQGMDKMMGEFKQSKIKNIEYNIVVLDANKWESNRYRDLCHLTGGLFYKLEGFTASAMNIFKKEFADKYNAMDYVEIEKIRSQNKQTFIQNNKNKPTELKFDYRYFLPE